MLGVQTRSRVDTVSSGNRINGNAIDLGAPPPLCDATVEEISLRSATKVAASK